MTIKNKDNEKRNKSLRTSIKVGEHIYDRIDDHVRTLKFLDKQSAQKKENWISSAIREKLKNEKKKGTHIPRDRTLSFSLDDKLLQELDKRVELNKKLQKGRGSRKQIIFEAILEKLAKEEHPAKQRFAKLNAD